MNLAYETVKPMAKALPTSPCRSRFSDQQEGDSSAAVISAIITPLVLPNY